MVHIYYKNIGIQLFLVHIIVSWSFTISAIINTGIFIIYDIVLLFLTDTNVFYLVPALNLIHIRSIIFTNVKTL